MKNKNITKKHTVKLRKKKLKNGNKSLYLDIWTDGKRKYEFLKLYIVKPQNSLDRDSNKKTMQLAEQIRAKRQIEIQSSQYGIDTAYKLETNFLSYFKSKMEASGLSKSNYSIWKSTLNHLSDYCNADTTFKQIDLHFIEGFKNYLNYNAKGKNNKLLSQNTKNIYFNTFRSVINRAFDEKIIPENPAKKVKTIHSEQPLRQYLSLEELKKLVKTECKHPVLKRAFLFSCLTGMRWSDIHKLKWSEIHHENGNWRIVFSQKKTKQLEYLDISKQASEYLGVKGKPNEKVFKDLHYSGWNNLLLQKWVFKAGINKEITFHCGRHTFAVLQLELGTDIYTVSKLLGHKSLSVTQIYAKIVDKKKRDAVNKIPNINF